MSTTDAQRRPARAAWLGMLTLSVAALPGCGGGSTPLDTTGGPSVVTPAAEPPRCETPLYPFTRSGVDTTSPTTLKACAVSDGVAQDFVRYELAGVPVCKHLDRSCRLLDGESCTHDCVLDSDCQAGSICVCIAGVALTAGRRLGPGVSQGPNRCLPAACTSAADCGGWACGLSHDPCGLADGFHCYSSRDECSSDADCDGNRRCSYSGDHWKCETRLSCE
ncbi:MAG: hypothetical protein OZ928_20415 [Polyangiaceae bacterium]|nr:hypothetical protein [Polyangiaceae bacterium]